MTPEVRSQLRDRLDEAARAASALSKALGDMRDEEPFPAATAAAQWSLTVATEALSLPARHEAQQLLPPGLVPDGQPFPFHVVVQWAVRAALQGAALLVPGLAQLEVLEAAGRLTITQDDRACLLNAADYAAARLQQEANRVVQLLRSVDGSDPRRSGPPLPSVN
jgi:hypothetical protein